MLLQDIWFFLWGLLWAVYFATDGFDLGTGVLMPFLGKTDDQRRIIYNAIGPLWNGNEVWLISAGGLPLLRSHCFIL
jgi:cytochrome d ubiquinol oxidase subunit II